MQQKNSLSHQESLIMDALYEEEEDTIKIGMDLTKVVRQHYFRKSSLLEMYADYFAHPDLFLKIADLDSPRDRIVQVCRWYLSALSCWT
ncbi:hypothetical protein DOY81_011420 [Sarcophaga bullata]|nr:hypothetical protein DOY81_011420 [Sarcophaga bullata]